MRRNKNKTQIEDEIINDWRYYTGQNTYWGITKQNKNIRVLKVRVILKNISASFSYRKYITQIIYPFAMNRCGNCMGCLRVKPCLRCYACKNITTKLCSKLICFYNPKIWDFCWPIWSNNKIILTFGIFSFGLQTTWAKIYIPYINSKYIGQYFKTCLLFPI